MIVICLTSSTVHYWTEMNLVLSFQRFISFRHTFTIDWKSKRIVPKSDPTLHSHLHLPYPHFTFRCYRHLHDDVTNRLISVISSTVLKFVNIAEYIKPINYISSHRKYRREPFFTGRSRLRTPPSIFKLYRAHNTSNIRSWSIWTVLKSAFQSEKYKRKHRERLLGKRRKKKKTESERSWRKKGAEYNDTSHIYLKPKLIAYICWMAWTV